MIYSFLFFQISCYRTLDKKVSKDLLKVKGFQIKTVQQLMKEKTTLYWIARVAYFVYLLSIISMIAFLGLCVFQPALIGELATLLMDSILTRFFLVFPGAFSGFVLWCYCLYFCIKFDRSRPNVILLLFIFGGIYAPIYFYRTHRDAE